jgi:3-hydroxy-3-methylglutaryl CoA synthase
MVGITSFGGYLPRLRLVRGAMVAANAWADPSLKALGDGVRAMCNWDEDSLTMAVAAARDCLIGQDRAALDAVHMASTTFPFADRQNAGILATALNLGERVATLDIGSSQRAATTGLIAALEAREARPSGATLFVAADKRRTMAASRQEMLFGDGAAALMLGGGEVVAEFVGSHSVSVDFVDHYRGTDREFDYNWEQRWIRDEGYLKIVPRAIRGLLQATGVAAGAVTRLLMPCVLPTVPPRIAEALGIAKDRVGDGLHAVCGDTGAAHPLVMLAHALQQARAGDRLLVVGFGQGCDALLFEVTDRIAELAPRQGITGSLAGGIEETNYNKFLAFNGLVTRDKGMRAELDKQTALSSLYRNRDMILGLMGGCCRICGTVQFPKMRVCVNPNCNARDAQDDRPFADRPGRLVTWSADHLTYSVDPPAHYGMVQFDEGGRFMADITDVEVGDVAVGMAVRMVFRIKEVDEQRGFTRYFWKAAPEAKQAPEVKEA